MNIPTLYDIQTIGVGDRGVPNKERIILRAMNEFNLQNFVVVLGIPANQEETKILPIPNYIYYFEDIVVPKYSWVVIYTGPGKTEISRLPTTHEPAYSFHWGHPAVLFTNPIVMPILFRVTEIGFPAQQLPALLPPQRSSPLTIGNV